MIRGWSWRGARLSTPVDPGFGPGPVLPVDPGPEPTTYPEVDPDEDADDLNTLDLSRSEEAPC